MLPLSGTTRIFLYRGATDMRKSFDGLLGMIAIHFSGESAYAGSVFVFVNRRRTHVKLLTFDDGGFVIWYKRLERGTFRMPRGASGRVELSSRELTMLLEGITPRRLNRRYDRPRPVYPAATM